MGASAGCCVKREGAKEEDWLRLERRTTSWQSVADPEEFLTFFDCCEDGVELHEPVVLRSAGRPAKRRSPTWHSIRDLGAVPSLVAVPEEHALNIPACTASQDALQRLIRCVRAVWLDRTTSGNDLDEQLSERLKEGFPELDEWTTHTAARRMLRAVNNDEHQAAQMLVKAIECRVRDRELFRSMRCRVTCDIRVIGTDQQQRPVIYMCSYSQSAPLKEILPQLFLAFEAATRIGHPEGQSVLVCDMVGFQPSLNMNHAALKEFSDSFGSVFADRLNFILIVDFSFVAQAVWSLCKPLLSERTRAKIKFTNEAGARQIAKARFQWPTCERVFSAFDINRDKTSTLKDRELHAQRTAICDVPLGKPAADEAG